ncbi:MAG: ATP synthase archaeal subunit H [Halobacteriota archaeon]
MKPQILYEIKDAEAKAQEMVNAAQAEKRKLIDDAKRRAFDIREAARKEATQNAEQMNASADTEIDQLKKDIFESGEKQVYAVRDKAQGKKAEALAQILEDFKRTAHV